jgi:hypothetical protein
MSTPLRDLITSRMEARWAEFADSHPNLAAAIDRVRLIDQTAQRLRDDPQFMAAMRQADLDEHKLLAAAKLLERAEQVIRQAISF